ncbi:response regulator [Paenibacillus mesophilus]|uniref:hybrid sensor histidine kinase/response regulator n=1 Tax=Paenibacillus mesophilus TaxID=2582849 RepID=UPI00110DB75C|nr:ATP-binding protein [Paenibacillus mesophilus]TMV52141.1 response regulator [Paenibacillus mesophilus]
MSTKKMLFILGLFLLTSVGIRLLWNQQYAPTQHVEAVRGVLDLRDSHLPPDYTIALNGEWEFFPHLFLQQDNGNSPAALPDSARRYVQVPGAWKSAFPEGEDRSFRFGTYRLCILLSDDNRQTLGIRTTTIKFASDIYVNGRHLSGSGVTAEELRLFEARNVPYTVSFEPDSSVIELWIRVSDHSVLEKGGITGSVLLGTYDDLTRTTLLSIGMQLLLAVVLLMHGLFAVIIYFVGPRPRKALSSFFMLVGCTIVGVLIDDDRVLLVWMPSIPGEWAVKLLILSYAGTAVFLIRLFHHLFPENGMPRAYRACMIVSFLFVWIVLLSPVQYSALFSKLLLFFMLLPSAVVPILLLRLAMQGKDDVIFLLISATSVAANVVWAAVKINYWNPLTFYPFDLIVAFLSFAAFWFKRFFRANVQAEKLAAELLKADKVKDDFLANTSHELRNPLHGIINIAQSVLDDERNTQNPQKLQLLVNVGRRMSLMLGDLLDVTRLKEKTVRLQPGRVNLQSVASGVVDMLRYMSEAKPIRFSITIPDSFPDVRADENRLIQILFNLLHNAVKFTNEGTIEIRARSRDNCAFIEVEDSGIGMDDSLQRRVFRPYEQGDAGVTAVGGGLGLGLSICKQLVELHGGVLEVGSVPGRGSVFGFTLPFAEESDLRDQPAYLRNETVVESETAAAVSLLSDKPIGTETERAFAGSKPHLLIVDDDPVNLNILESILTQEQYEITKALNGMEAISKLETKHYDLIISDVMMPHMSGYELTRGIRARFSVSELPILLLTARSRTEDIDAGFLAGANDYVTKPVDALELRARVRALTELKQSVHERLRMEAAWLQAQFQPHFLFNTLNSISALGDIDTDRMQLLLEKFGHYLRTSFEFHHTEHIIPLERELELVRSYLYIEKERFEERLQVSLELDESLRLQLPPLTIQPIVENAVRHGILQRPGGGTIRIRTTDCGSFGEIAIIDDGVGMDENRVQSLLDSTADGRRGIGLRNTDRRLRQHYGLGLSIQSIPGKGTTVSYQIPK